MIDIQKKIEICRENWYKVDCKGLSASVIKEAYERGFNRAYQLLRQNAPRVLIGGEIPMEIKELEIDAMHAFNNEEYEGLSINWVSNIGFGECNIYLTKPEGKWQADTEHMCTNENRAFLKMLLEKVADTVEISN